MLVVLLSQFFLLQVAIGESICMCQRVVSDTAPAGTVDYIETCGDCEEARNGDVALEPDSRRDDRDQERKLRAM